MLADLHFKVPFNDNIAFLTGMRGQFQFFMLRLFAVFAAYIKRFGDSVSERRGKAEICHAVSIVDLLPFPVSRQSIRLQSRAAPFDNIGYIYIKS